MSWADNKSPHFALAVEGVGFSSVCLATLGILGYKIQAFLQTSYTSGIPISGGRISPKKKKRELVIRVTYEGKVTEKRYSVSAIDSIVTITAKIIERLSRTRITASILGMLKRDKSVEAHVGKPVQKEEGVHAKIAEGIMIKAKLK